MFLKIEETPNPNTLKFIPEKSLDFKGTKLYKEKIKLITQQFLKQYFQ